MKLADFAKGTRALKPVRFPLFDGTEIECSVRPLLGSEDVDILEAARAFAIARGLPEPKDGDELYQRAKWVHTLLHGCVDPDKPAEPFFASAEEILEHLDIDRIALLFEEQQHWQAKISPRVGSLSHDEYVKSIVMIGTAGAGDDLPFWSWQPVVQETWLRSTAALALSSLEPRSPSGKASPSSSKNETSPPAANS